MHPIAQRWLVAALLLAGVLGWQLSAASAADGTDGGTAMPNPF